jgi:hypothetical protein
MAHEAGPAGVQRPSRAVKPPCTPRRTIRAVIRRRCRPAAHADSPDPCSSAGWGRSTLTAIGREDHPEPGTQARPQHRGLRSNRRQVLLTSEAPSTSRRATSRWRTRTLALLGPAHGPHDTGRHGSRSSLAGDRRSSRNQADRDGPPDPAERTAGVGSICRCLRLPELPWRDSRPPTRDTDMPGPRGH